MNERGGIKTWLLAFIAATGLSFGALIGLGCAFGANACPFTERKPFTSTDGAVIWTAQCAACHGREGEGRAGPSLVAGDAATLTEEELVAKISDGKPLAGMPAFKRSLSPEQIRAVAGYVLTLRSEG